MGVFRPFPSRLAAVVSGESQTPLTAPSHTTLCVHHRTLLPAASKVCPLSFVLSSFTVMFLNLFIHVFFAVIPLGVGWEFRICELVFFTSLGVFSAIVCWQVFSVALYRSSSFRTPIICVFDVWLFDLVPQILWAPDWFFLYFFFFLFIQFGLFHWSVFNSLCLSFATSSLLLSLSVCVHAQLLSHAWLCDPMNCMQPIRLLCPWDSPGKNTEVDCHFLLQRIFPTQW